MYMVYIMRTVHTLMSLVRFNAGWLELPIFLSHAPDRPGAHETAQRIHVTKSYESTTNLLYTCCTYMWRMWRYNVANVSIQLLHATKRAFAIIECIFEDAFTRAYTFS